MKSRTYQLGSRPERDERRRRGELLPRLGAAPAGRGPARRDRPGARPSPRVRRRPPRLCAPCSCPGRGWGARSSRPSASPTACSPASASGRSRPRSPRRSSSSTASAVREALEADDNRIGRLLKAGASDDAILDGGLPGDALPRADRVRARGRPGARRRGQGPAQGVGRCCLGDPQQQGIPAAALSRQPARTMDAETEGRRADASDTWRATAVDPLAEQRDGKSPAIFLRSMPRPRGGDRGVPLRRDPRDTPGDRRRRLCIRPALRGSRSR